MSISKNRLNIDNIVKEFQYLIIKYNNLYPAPSNDTQMDVDILPPVQGKVLIKEHMDNYLALIGEFALLANQLEEFKQPVDEKKYDDNIYTFIQYVDEELLVQQLRKGKVDMDIVLEGKEKYRLYGLVPRSQLIMQCISIPLKVLYYLWNHPVEGVNHPLYQLGINYCIKIIIDTINCVQYSVCKMEYYQKNYYDYEYGTHGVLHDYQGVLCASLYIAMQKGATQQDLDGEDVFFHLDCLLDCLFENKNPHMFTPTHETFTGELSTIYYQDKYPGFKKSFDNPLEYFTPYNANIGQWVMFANVPNIPKYHQLLKIRAAIKKFYGLAQLFTEQTRQQAIKYCINWVIWQVPRFLELRNKKQKLFLLHNPSITLETLAESEVQLKKHIQMLSDSTPIFKQMCEAYLEIFEHPFYLLEEIYWEMAKERSGVVQNGREYSDIDIYKQMVDEQMVDEQMAK